MTPRCKFDLSLLPERPDLTFESELWTKGLRFVAGVDEAGRGALAGPVSAGVVVLPPDEPELFNQLGGVQDSKIMMPQQREEWAVVIKEIAADWGVGFASSEEIDQIGIVPATCLAASRALAKVNCSVDHILVDFLNLPNIMVPQTPLVKGDARSLSIASAAILAKTTRDAFLIELEAKYPGYHFASNKGYGTEMHRQAIHELGPSEQHRRTFSPISEYFSLFPPETFETK